MTTATRTGRILTLSSSCLTPDPGNRTGVAAMADAHREHITSWTHVHNQADEFRVLDTERVLVLLRIIARGKTNGVDLGQMQNEAAALFHVHEGKVRRLVIYWDRDRALADLGLEE